MNQEEFIKTIAPYCVKHAQKYGFKVASPSIAQACLESGYGTSAKAKHHNYFGLKYRPNRVFTNNGTFVDGSTEQNKDGSYVKITDQWFNFDTMEKGVEGYFQFINVAIYAQVKHTTTPLEYLQQLHKAGYATSLKYVDSVNKIIQQWNLTKYDAETSIQFATNQTVPQGGNNMSNSSLVNCVVKSPHHSGKRAHTIDRITPHCVVGQLTAEGIGGCFKSTTWKASCNYGIGTEGRIVLVVDEDNHSWCSSNGDNDDRAVTIECASDKQEPYAFNDVVYNKLIDLCTDICKRNGKNKLLWIEDKNNALNYTPKANEMLLTVHRWFKNKSCPGNWMYARMSDLANRVNNQLAGNGSSPAPSAPKSQTPTSTTSAFLVKVTCDELNIRKGPGTNYGINGIIRDRGTYTIIETTGSWGLLKSYKAQRNGWISLNYTKRV